MNKENFQERLTDLSGAMEHLADTLELAEEMVSILSYGSITEDEAKFEAHIRRLWGLMSNVVEIAKAREKDVDALLKMAEAPDPV